MGGGAAAGGDFDAVLAANDQQGFRGLYNNKKALGLATFASLGGVLYGYNQGVFGQVQVMQEFVCRYQGTLGDQVPQVKKGMLTAILELAAAVGAIIAGPVSDIYSRKYSISGWCVIFILGVAIQTGGNYNVATQYAGRWFAGMGVGALSMLVPMYNAELAPPGIRGSLVALQQLAITFGILVSYWIAYGTNFIGGPTFDCATGVGQSQAAWRIPLGIQMVPALLLLVGACFLPFSPRWLMLRGREEECLMNLAKLRRRAPEAPDIQLEFRALQAERLVEQEAAKERYGVDQANFSVAVKEYKRLLTTKPLLHRLMLGAGAQALQQWTGINAIIYYAPTIFRGIGLEGPTIGLLATGIVGVVNFVFTIPAVLFVDNFGRKPMLAGGEAIMAICHATIGAIVAVYGGRFDQGYKSAGNGAVFMVYLYIATFAVTWGPLAWVVSAEVFPLDMRAKGMSISSAVNWLMNFTVALTTPVMFQTLGRNAYGGEGFGTYFVFMGFCIIGFLYSVFLLPELKGLTLEEVDAIFKDQSGAEDRARRERVAKQIGLDKAVQDVQHTEKRGNHGSEAV